MQIDDFVALMKKRRSIRRFRPGSPIPDEHVNKILEAARWASHLRPGGVAIVADVVVIPISAIDGKIPYPSWDEIKVTLAEYTDQIYLIPATRIAEEVGNPRAVNMVMLGFLSAFLALKPEVWTDTMRLRLPPKFRDSSIEAFIKGADEAKPMISVKGP